MGHSLVNNHFLQFLLFTAGLAIVGFSFLVINAKDNLKMMIYSSILSLFAVFNYSLLKAPDVAITEVAVNSALSTILLILGLVFTGQRVKENISPKKIKIALCFFVWIALSYIFIDLPDFDNPDSENHAGIASHYIKNTLIDFDIPNIVTAILGGYRGFDTLFETTVILTAACAVCLILKRRQP